MIAKFPAKTDVRCGSHSMSLLFEEQLLGIHNRNSLGSHLGLKLTMSFVSKIGLITVEWWHKVSHGIAVLILGSNNRFSRAKRTHTHAINKSVTFTAFTLTIRWVTDSSVITINASAQVVGARSVGVTEIAFVTNTFTIFCALKLAQGKKWFKNELPGHFDHKWEE